MGQKINKPEKVTIVDRVLLQETQKDLDDYLEELRLARSTPPNTPTKK
jgi:hypothetical protein